MAFKHRELYNKGLLQTNLRAPTDMFRPGQSVGLFKMSFYGSTALRNFYSFYGHVHLVISAPKEQPKNFLYT